MKPMSEVFELPVTVVEVESKDAFSDTDYMILDSTDTTCGEMYSRSEAQHAAYAINMHDSLVEALEVLIMHTDRNKPNSVVLNHVHTVLSKARGE